MLAERNLRGDMMGIPFEVIVALAAGLIIMALIGYLLLIPRRFLWRMAAGGVLGAIVLFIMNLFKGIIGFSVALNPFTALIVGILGLPGALLIALLTVYIL